MKILFGCWLLLTFIGLNLSCQQNTQLLTSVSPSPSAAQTDINDRDKIDEELKKAVENQDIEKIRQLLSLVKEPSPLIKAINKEDVELAEELLKQGANPNAIEWWEGDNPSYKTALWCAIVGNDKRATELLLKYGADINKVYAVFDTTPSKKKWDYSTALSIALDGSSGLEMAQILVAHGASIKDEKNVLRLAPSLMTYLINNGADINEQDQDGNTILTYWWIEPDLSTLERYLKNGANPYLKNKKGKNAFDAVRENKLLSTEVYTPYIPEQKSSVVLHRKLNSLEKRKAIKLMKKYGAKFLPKQNK